METQDQYKQNPGNHIHQETQITENVHIGCQTIPWSNTVKYLDVTLGTKLTWFKAIERRANLAHPALAKLYPLIAKNSRFKRSIKIQLHLMCVRPIITYGYQIWAGAAKSYINKVQLMQNKFLRIILNRHRRTPIALLHQQANIPTIAQYIQNSLTRTYNKNHPNPLIRNAGNYHINDISLNIRVRLSKHANNT